MRLIRLLASFLLPQTLYKTVSPISGEITVSQYARTRSLIVGGLVQSVNWDSPTVGQRVWGRLVKLVCKKSDSLAFPIRSVLVLGLGGGTIPQLLQNRYSNISVESVEIDHSIAAIAKEYFELSRLRNFRLIIGDAVNVILNPESFNLLFKAYDLIIVDIYLGSIFPTGAETEKFVTGLKKLLSPRGFCVINSIEPKGKLYSVLEVIFGKVEVTQVKGYSGASNFLYLIENS